MFQKHLLKSAILSQKLFVVGEQKLTFLKLEAYPPFQNPENLYPSKGGAEHSRRGPLDGLSNLYVFGELKFGFKKY